MSSTVPGCCGWRIIATLSIVIGTAGVGCKDHPAGQAPAAPPAPAALPPSAPAPEAAVAAPAPPPSPLRTALLAVHDVAGFRALAAEAFRLVESQGKRPPRVVVTLPRDHLDAKLFDKKIKPWLPHEPDPAGGEGEDFACNEGQRSCVFADQHGRATTYMFDEGALPAKVREIRVGALPTE